MTYLLAAFAISASGYCLLRLLRLDLGRAAVDLPLAWFAGSAWLGLAAFTARGLLGIPSGAASSAVILLLPPAAFGVLSWRRREAVARARPEERSRWIPRPAWLFAVLAAWTLAVAVAVALHGPNTPVHTDDALRVRAFAPLVVLAGDWSDPARNVIAMAGPIPSYVPPLAWQFGAEPDAAHVSIAIVLTFLALLALLVALGSVRGAPERGWAGAFAVASLPFLAYHAASTYADAWLGMFLAGGTAFFVEYGRTREPADAGRAALLLLGAAMVKREGELLAVPMLVVLVSQVAWRGRQDGWRPVARLAGLCSAGVLLLAARVATMGTGGAFPFLRAAAARAGVASDAVALAPPSGGQAHAGAGAIFLDALFRDGSFGILYWVLLASLVLLFPRIRRNGLGWAGVAVAIVFAETAASALWLYPQFTLDHSTVHRSLLSVSAVAAVWLAALLAPAPEVAATPAPAEPRSVRRARRRAGARA